MRHICFAICAQQVKSFLSFRTNSHSLYLSQRQTHLFCHHIYSLICVSIYIYVWPTGSTNTLNHSNKKHANAHTYPNIGCGATYSIVDSNARQFTAPIPKILRHSTIYRYVVVAPLLGARLLLAAHTHTHIHQIYIHLSTLYSTLLEWLYDDNLRLIAFRCRKVRTKPRRARRI